MKCYNLSCKEKCNDFKIQYCIFKLTEKQQKFIAKIKKHKNCLECGNITVKAKYKDKVIDLCTQCGVRANENKNISSSSFDISSNSA